MADIADNTQNLQTPVTQAASEQPLIQPPAQMPAQVLGGAGVSSGGQSFPVGIIAPAKANPGIPTNPDILDKPDILVKPDILAKQAQDKPAAPASLVGILASGQGQSLGQLPRPAPVAQGRVKAGEAQPAQGSGQNSGQSFGSLSLHNSLGSVGNTGAAPRPQPFAKNPQNFSAAHQINQGNQRAPLGAFPGAPSGAHAGTPLVAQPSSPPSSLAGANSAPHPEQHTGSSGGAGSSQAGGRVPLAHIAGQVADTGGASGMSGQDDGTDPGYPQSSAPDSRKEVDNSAAWALEPEPSQVDFYPPMLQCVAYLFKIFNKPVSANVIASRLPTGQASHRPTAILRAAKEIGLESNIIAKATLDQISPLTLPAILMLQNENACILTSYDDENAKVIFPEQGATVNIPREELEKDYIGYAVFAQLESQLDARASKVKLLDTKKWFWGTIVGFMPIYKHVVSCSVIINILALSGPLFFMNVYDKVLPNKLNAVETLWALAIGIVITYVFDFALKNLRSYFVDLAGRNADIIIAGKLMQQVLNMRMDAKPESTGSLANNLREFESLRDFFSSSTMTVLVDIPFLFVFLGIIMYLGGPLVIVPVAAIPIVVIIGIFMQFPMQNSAEKGFKENMQKNALLVELINGLETVKTSMAEGRMMNAWEKVVGMSALSNADSKRMASLSINASVMLTQLVSVGLIIVGVYRYSDGLITMGGIIASNMLAGRAMAPLSQLAGMFSRLQQSRMALKALDQLMQLPIENVASDSYVEFGHLEHSFSAEEVSFKYPNSERASLERINFFVKPGEKVGIIGAMGSGKSTLGRLCVGLYQPSEGAIKMGGVDIRQLDTTTLRSRIGYVSQDNYLFYGTVRENIAFGASNVDDRMILRAANIAGVTDFVRNNPAGFGMQVGERGMNVSGGQRQSVAIARALLRDPDILIMDEPSSNMDNYSENMLKHRLATTMGSKTVIIITHRLSMLDLVQRLIVMDQGHLYADGPKEKVLEFLKSEQNKTAAKRNMAQQGAVTRA